MATELSLMILIMVGGWSSVWPFYQTVAQAPSNREILGTIIRQQIRPHTYKYILTFFGEKIGIIHFLGSISTKESHSCGMNYFSPFLLILCKVYGDSKFSALRLRGHFLLISSLYMRMHSFFSRNKTWTLSEAPSITFWEAGSCFLFVFWWEREGFLLLGWFCFLLPYRECVYLKNVWCGTGLVLLDDMSFFFPMKSSCWNPDRDKLEEHYA